MNELEQKLRSLRLAAPSMDLDRRMGDTFAAAARTRTPAPRATLWWWLAAAGVASALTAMFLLSRRLPPPPAQQTVYRIEAEGRLRELLLTPPASRASPPPMVVRTNPS
jgi:hypothetical protein